jgi:hypothetical protein
MGSCVRSSLAVLAATVGLLLAPGAVASPTSDHRLTVTGKDCGEVAFTPGTDDVAAGIRARRIGCDRVSRRIRRLHARGIEPNGFECREWVHEDGLTHTDHRCTSADRRFSWQKF